MRNICEQFLQLRGIVYPKWTKLTKNETGSTNESKTRSSTSNSTDDNNNEKEVSAKWIIEKYVYAFSKHIQTPNEVKMKINMKSEYYEHVRHCPFNVVVQLPKRVKIFPPFN